MTEEKQMAEMLDNASSQKQPDEEEKICIQMQEDIYSAVVLLKYKKKLKEFDKMEKWWLITLAVLAAFVQLGSVILFFGAMVSSIWFTNHYEEATINGEYVLIETYTGLDAPTPRLKWYEYFWRLFAYLVLLSYTTPFVKSLIDYIVLINTLKQEIVWYFIMMTLLQITLYVSTIGFASFMIFHQLDIIDIFSVGISLIILLEVDNYLYKSVETSVLSKCEHLFVIKLTTQQTRNTLYGKYKPLIVQMFISCLVYIPIIINLISQILLGNVGSRTLGDTAGWIGFVLFYVLFAVPVCSIFYPLIKSYRTRKNY